MGKLEMDPKVIDALKEYYEKTGANPPLLLTSEVSHDLQPGQKVTLPAPKAAPKG